MRLNGGILSDSGVYLVLCETNECDEDEAIICAGRVDKENLALKALTTPAEIVSMIPTRGEWHTKAEAVSISADGKVTYLTDSTAEYEVIPGFEGWADKPGGPARMTMLKQIGDRLFALGYRGQIFVREPETGWESLSVPLAAVRSGFNICLYDVVSGPNGRLYFSGMDLAVSQRDDEIIAADLADDDDLWLELLLSEPSDQMGLRYLEGGNWHDLAPNFQGAATVLIETRPGTWTLFNNYGVAWKTTEFESFEEVVALGEGRTFWDIKEIDGGVALLVGQVLSFLEDDALVPFDPPLPILDDGYINITGNSRQLAAFHSEGMFVLQDNVWRAIDITLTT